MVEFTRLIPDSNIIKAAEDHSSVAIVGCTACANSSIAYEKDQPIYEIKTDETTGKTRRLPYALQGQIGNLKKLLEEKGVNVKTEMINALCFATDDGGVSDLLGKPSWADLGIIERCADVEAFITLCCSMGVFGLKQRFGKDITIVPGMRDAGTGQLFLELDEGKEYILIDRDRSTVIRKK
jgi:hypothetical protein